jgi:hypothetical protein
MNDNIGSTKLMPRFLLVVIAVFTLAHAIGGTTY